MPSHPTKLRGIGHTSPIDNHGSTLGRLVLAMAILMTSACAFKSADDSTPLGAKPAEKPVSSADADLNANRPLVREDFKHEFIPGKKLNDYSVRVSWPLGRPLQVKLLQGPNVLKTFDARTENVFEIDCSAGRAKFGIRVVSLQSGTLADIEMELKCPFDMELAGGTSELDALKQVTGRLVLGSNAKIGVGPESLELNLNELIIRDLQTGVPASAAIVSFDDDRKGLPPNRGVTPPNIIIRAKKASGTLVLNLNGIDGQRVTDLRDVPSTAPKAPPGAPGEFKEVCSEKYDKKAGGLVGFCKDVCTKQPENGRPGTASTITGRVGDDGNPGIGTPNVTLDIIDASGLSIVAIQNPGKASAPGLGALPLGGIGGEPGGNPGAGCSSATKGPMGASGTRGAPGNPAAHGGCGLISVSPSVMGKIEFRVFPGAIDCGDPKNILRTLELRN